MATERPWRIWIDTGGTFTDCVALDPEGRVRRAKVLSAGSLRGRIGGVAGARRVVLRTDWGAPSGFIDGFRFVGLESGVEAGVVRYDAATGEAELSEEVAGRVGAGERFEVRTEEQAPVLAARLVTGTPAGAALPPVRMRLATTRGTNALLERRGRPVGLFITRGFADLLEIGDQQRPDLFALEIRKARPLHADVAEVDERLGADGSVVRGVSVEGVERAAEGMLARGVRAAAVVLLHSWRNPAHERAVAEVLRGKGFEHVSVSSELAPLIKALPRAQTCVVNAYLSEVIEGYLRSVERGLGARGRVRVMTSAGGLVASEGFRPKESLLSGPAGGVVGAAAAAERSGFSRVITFDMGGTSTDVARYDGAHEYTFEHEVGDARIVAPAVAVESVAAGGGSICALAGEGLCVGPESAGSRPGPACYGAGGPLTVTDVNLLLGRLDGRRFGIPIDREAAERRLGELIEAVAARTGRRPEREALLRGLIDVADERMADAIRRVSVRRGYDPAEHALVAFGGAGGQHACGVAERLGISTVVVPADPGLLSAVGLGHAGVERFAERQVLGVLGEVEGELAGIVEELRAGAVAAVREEEPEGALSERVLVSLRFVGQESSMSVEWDGGEDLGGLFRAQHEAVFGHAPEDRAVEVESVRVVVRAAGEAGWEGERAGGAGADADRSGAAPVFERGALGEGARVEGPALIVEAHSTTFVREGWAGKVDRAGAIVLRRGAGARAAEAPEVVKVELFTNRLREIAREAGEMLRRTALSTNVKERLDFSCAVLDADGELVVNAPHIPVHLGALGLCVREVRKVVEMGPGDAVVTNHPAFGGSHLPDVTVISPVHGPSGALLGYVASRAHHAEIGGSRPGSMPPAARTLAEEGVVIPPMHLVRGGRARWGEVRALLRGGAHPSRAVEDNVADLAAALAANRRGAASLVAMAEREGEEQVRRSMAALTGMAEARAREALRRLGDRAFEAEERLDDGTPLRVRIEVRDGRAVVDFAGSGGVHPGNLNATPAIVRSAVMYVLRLLIDEPLPLNEGLMRAVEVVVPPGILNPPFVGEASACPAVAGGNTETSQRVVDTLIKALGLAACGQGTMNNVLFGNARFGYYETVCGGAGAGRGFDGASAVHTHMTNTRITDPEVLEHRYPVRLERFAVRRGSGGEGRWRGGDGAVREIVFLEDVEVSVLTQHRAEGPYGLGGGGAGMPGAQRLVRVDGGVVELGAVDAVEARAGDRLVLETPGGGGVGG